MLPSQRVRYSFGEFVECLLRRKPNRSLDANCEGVGNLLRKIRWLLRRKPFENRLSRWSGEVVGGFVPGSSDPFGCSICCTVLESSRPFRWSLFFAIAGALHAGSVLDFAV
jgi:hypothetical protein